MLRYFRNINIIFRFRYDQISQMLLISKLEIVVFTGLWEIRTWNVWIKLSNI